MRIVLSGTGSSVGKTTISTGIMKVLSEEFKVQPFKVGPDYIDPTYHTIATGNYSRNLDSFFMKPGQIRDSYLKAVKNKDMGIIEGVRGLYEGIDSVNDIGSTSSVAKALDSPVILIIDSRSLVKSAAALVLGFKQLDPMVNIQGVILNKVKDKNHYLKTKKSIENLVNVEVLGGINRNDSITIKERHLGLVPAVEMENSKKYIDLWAELVRESIDIDRLVEIMRSAPKIKKDLTNIWTVKNKSKINIGVAYDKVFNFYYKENLEGLEANNAKLKYFSPLSDENLPDVDGLYIGGGYPELFSKEISKNESLMSDIKRFHNDNRPIYAECGGLLYLMKAIKNEKMVNIYPYESVLTDKVQALKYTIAEVKNDNIISKKGEKFNGHEFHYTKVLINKDNIKNNFAFDILRGKGSYNKQDGFLSENTLASFVHTHIAALPNFGSNLTIAAKEL